MSLVKTFSENTEEPITESIENNGRIYKEVTILNVDSPDLIYVSFNDPKLTAQYLDLQKTLQALSMSEQKPNCDTKLCIDSKCIIYDKNKKQLLRAIVIKSNDEDYEMFLYDIAEKTTVPKNQVWLMTDKVLSYPNFAIMCHLANLKPSGDSNKWSLTATEYLKDLLTREKRIMVTKQGAIATKRKSFPINMVYLEYIEGGPLEKSTYKYIDINLLLVNKGLAFKMINKDSDEEISNNKDTDTSITEADEFANTSTYNSSIDWNDLMGESENEVTKPKSITNWPKPFPFKKRNFEAIATYVDHDGGIYLYDAKLQPVIQKMESEMKMIFQNTPSEPLNTSWNIGDLCTVRYFANNNWYRGKVIRINSNDTLQILMTDYGNDEECKYEDIRKKIVYQDFPTFSTKVHLYGIDRKISDWITSDLDLLHTTVVDKTVFVQIKANFNCYNQSAYIFVDDQNVTELLVEKPNVNNSPDVMVISDDDESKDVVLENDVEMIPLSTSLESMKLITYTYVSLPTTDTINVTVINVINFNELIVHIVNGSRDDRQFDEMSKVMNKLGYSMAYLENVHVGQVCIALFNDDMQWYRAEIVNLNDDGRATVRFVDFGNFDSVPMRNLRYINPEWLAIPVEQYVAKLTNIELACEDFKEEVFAFFETFYNTIKTAKILSREPFSIEIYEHKTKNLSYQMLLDKKLIRLKT